MGHKNGGIRNKGNGGGARFLRALLADAPPTCVTWPLFRDVNGYGRVGYNGKLTWAHTLMCEMVHGPRPSPDHEATHSCGNGKEGCVNPRHLLWGTRSRNQKDRRFHGTKAEGQWKRPSRRKLTQADVEEIRRLRGQKTQRAIAARFGVTDATIRDIYSGKSWSSGPVKWKELAPAEVAEVRSLFDYLFDHEIGPMFGVGRNTIRRIRAGQSYRDIAA